MYRNVCERNHEHFTLKIGNKITAHELKTRSRVNNELVLLRYTNSKCQNAHIFRGLNCGMRLIMILNNRLANLARFKKYLKVFLLKCSENLD